MDILVLGELAGASGPLSARRFVSIDVDTFDERFRRIAPRLALSRAELAGDAHAIVLSELDELHPDALYRRLPLFEAFRETRRRLVDPSTFAATAASIGPPETAPELFPATDPDETERETLKRLLGTEPGARVPGDERDVRTGVESFIRSVVAPYVVPGKDPRQDEWVDSFDRSIADAMREVLHDPAFRRLESLWRSLRRLVAEASDETRILLLDVSRAELDADLAAAAGDPSASAIARSIAGCRDGLGEDAAAVLVGAYRFGPGAADLATLAGLGAIAAGARAPLLAEADPQLAGCPSLAESPTPRGWRPDADAQARWLAVRRSPVARWIGLALPRVLVRLPYGLATDPIESFAFEEIPEGHDHETYLWGNPAFALAALVARAHAEQGVALELDAAFEIEDLPAHSYRSDGESRLQPCAEVLLGEAAAAALAAQGLIPLLSRADRNSARLERFRSIAEPDAPLAGAWS